MYHVLTTAITVIILYLVSYSLQRIGFYPVQYHRKIWNILLAVSFLFTAVAGIVLALQINYNWNIPFIKTLLKWHVEFGAGLAMTGTLHFLWHLSYFGSLFKRHGKNDSIKSQYEGKSEIACNLFLVGFISSAFQLLLIREMMNISGGFELITGTFLGSWLIGSALGALLAGRSALTDLRKLNLTFSLSPLISLLLLILLTRLLLNPGETPSFLVTIIFTFVVLAPFCLVSGFTFVRLIAYARTTKGYVPGKSFSIETSGGIMAGLAVTVLGAGILNTYQMIFLVVLSGISGFTIFYSAGNKRTKIAIKIATVIVASVIITCNPDIPFRQLLLRGIKVTGTHDTPYGNITEGVYSGESSLYYNQRLHKYNDDLIEREENIHYAMLQSNNPERVLLISGSPDSHIPELVKYPVKEIVYLERDPGLIRYESIPGSISSARITIKNDDAFRYIRKNDENFDVIIMLLPPPSSLLLNRYYTTEFFGEVKNRLNDGGVFMCSPEVNPNYFNQESVNLFSSIYNSMSDEFRYIIPVAGNKLYFVASDTPVSTSFCKLTTQKNINNTYVSPDFLDDDLVSARSEEIASLIDKNIRPNTLARPVACFYFQSFSISRNIDQKSVAIVLLVILFALPVIIVKRAYMIMYSSALALAGLEIIILLILQATIGNMYQMTGLVIAGLMTGLAAGSGLKTGFLNTITIRNKTIILFLFYLIAGLTINYIIDLNGSFIIVSIILVLSFIPALITGSIFRSLTQGGDDSGNTHSVYSADLAGSALGFILVSGLLIPVFGLKISLLFLALFIFAALAFGTISNK